MRKLLLPACALLALGTLYLAWLGRAQREARPRAAQPALVESRPAPPVELASVAQPELAARELSVALDPQAQVAPSGMAPARTEAQPVAAAEAAHRFFGRALDGRTGAPIAGAQVLSGPGAPVFRAGSAIGGVDGEHHPRSGADGCFELRSEEPWELAQAFLAAPGYGPASFLIEADHATPESAVPVELLPAAELEVLLCDPDGAPQAGLTVELGGPGGFVSRGNAVMTTSSPSWSATSRPDGRALFTGLSPEVALELTVKSGEKVLLVRERFALLPGERRRLECTVALATLRGWARDQDGLAVGDCELWATRAADGRSWYFHDQARVVGSAHTDARGTFAFEGLSLGDYLVGPAPRETRDFVPIGTPVVLDRREVEVELALTRGLPITGRVQLAPGDEPSFLAVYARPAAEARELVEAQMGDEGVFRFPPLVPGDYDVYAWDLGHATQPVRVPAGTRDLELRFPEQVALRVRWHPAVEVEVQILERQHQDGLWFSSCRGEFEHELPPGTYSLTLRTPDERIGFLPEVLVAAAPLELSVELASGASLTVAHQGSAQRREFLAWVGGGILQRQELAPGEACTLLAPPGDVRLELREGERVVASEELVLVSGERRRVELVVGE